MRVCVRRASTDCNHFLAVLLELKKLVHSTGHHFIYTGKNVQDNSQYLEIGVILVLIWA